MSSCCDTSKTSAGVNRFFSRRSKHYARRFGKKGLERTQQYLIEGVKRKPITAKEVLDIGCRVGALHLTLLNQGAARSVGVEISEGMIAEAKRLASESGVAERTRYILGDFVEVADSLTESDITLLDKVVLLLRATRRPYHEVNRKDQEHLRAVTSEEQHSDEDRLQDTDSAGKIPGMELSPVLA